MEEEMAIKDVEDVGQKGEVSKKAAEHQHRRQLKDKLKEELLLKNREEAEKEQKRLEKEAERRRELEALQKESFIQQASMEFGEKKTSRKNKSSASGNDAKENTSSVGGSFKSISDSAANVGASSEPWQEYCDDNPKANTDEIRFQSIKPPSEREGRRARDEFSARDSQKITSLYKLSHERDRSNLSSNKSHAPDQYSKKAAIKSASPNDEFWDEVNQDDFPELGAGSASQPKVNVWEERQSKMQMIEQLKPQNESEEEQMLRMALEMSRAEALEDQRRRNEINEEYYLQMKFLSENPEIAAQLECVDEVCGATGVSSDMGGYDEHPSLRFATFEDPCPSDEEERPRRRERFTSATFSESYLRKKQHDISTKSESTTSDWPVNESSSFNHGSDGNSGNHDMKGAKPKYKQFKNSSKAENSIRSQHDSKYNEVIRDDVATNKLPYYSSGNWLVFNDGSFWDNIDQSHAVDSCKPSKFTDGPFQGNGGVDESKHEASNPVKKELQGNAVSSEYVDDIWGDVDQSYDLNSGPAALPSQDEDLDKEGDVDESSETEWHDTNAYEGELGKSSETEWHDKNAFEGENGSKTKSASSETSRRTPVLQQSEKLEALSDCSADHLSQTNKEDIWSNTCADNKPKKDNMAGEDISNPKPCNFELKPTFAQSERNALESGVYVCGKQSELIHQLENDTLLQHEMKNKQKSNSGYTWDEDLEHVLKSVKGLHVSPGTMALDHQINPPGDIRINNKTTVENQLPAVVPRTASSFLQNNAKVEQWLASTQNEARPSSHDSKAEDISDNKSGYSCGDFAHPDVRKMSERDLNPASVPSINPPQMFPAEACAPSAASVPYLPLTQPVVPHPGVFMNPAATAASIFWQQAVMSANPFIMQHLHALQMLYVSMGVPVPQGFLPPPTFAPPVLSILPPNLSQENGGPQQIQRPQEVILPPEIRSVDRSNFQDLSSVEVNTAGLSVNNFNLETPAIDPSCQMQPHASLLPDGNVDFVGIPPPKPCDKVLGSTETIRQPLHRFNDVCPLLQHSDQNIKNVPNNNGQ